LSSADDCHLIVVVVRIQVSSSADDVIVMVVVGIRIKDGG